MQHTPPRRSSATVLLVGVDALGAGQIRECLAGDAAIPNDIVHPYESSEAVRRYRPQVVIVGFDADPDAALTVGSTLQTEYPHLILIAHATMAQPERIRAAMRAGFRDFVVLPEDAALLRRTVREAPSDTVTVSDQGQVVAVIGAKGGVGSTFVTVNLGAELAPENRVCAVDLDFSMGDVAGMLDMEPASHMADLLNNVSRLDERMLAGSVGVHPSGSMCSHSPWSLVENEFLRGEDVLRVLSAAADAYQYLLVDCGGRIDDATRTASTVADLILFGLLTGCAEREECLAPTPLLERQGGP